MGAYFDIVLSILIGTSLLLMIFLFNIGMIETGHKNNMYYATQKTGFEFQEILRDDLIRIGLNVPDTAAVFISADSNQIEYNTDYNLDSNIVKIKYYLGSTSSADFTENPNDKLLYRKVNNDPPVSFSIGLINFNFTYYDASGNQTANLNEIEQVGYNFYLESTYEYDNEYPGIYIDGRINLKNVN